MSRSQQQADIHLLLREGQEQSLELRQDLTAQAGIIHNLPALALDSCMGLPCSDPVPFVLVVFLFLGGAICFVFILLVVVFPPRQGISG